MPAVVSLGSLNVDRIRHISPADLRTLDTDAEWLPDPGETRRVPELPTEVIATTTNVALGGKGANQAVAAAKAGASTVMLGAVGMDQESVDMLPSLRRAGVDVSKIAIREDPTGTALVLVEPDGENRIALQPGANATVDPAYVRTHQDLLTTAECVLIQNEIPIDATLEALSLLERERDPPVVLLDPAPSTGAEPLIRSGAIDIVTPNAEEAAHLEPILEETSMTIIRTRGPGPVQVSGEYSMTVQPPAVDSVDATAAGDVLVGYLGAGLARSEPLEVALERAVLAASLSTKTPGAQPSIPDRATVERFLDRVDRTDIDEG